MTRDLFSQPGKTSDADEAHSASAPTASRTPRAPLADRMRPRTLDEIVGQPHLTGPDGLVRRAIAAGSLPSLVFWGPPGTGKTTLARVAARALRQPFVPFSAVTGSVRDVRRIVDEARARRRVGGPATVLFVDEIHRFNKAQQDAFLPHVEDGTLVLLGATTENPSFALNAALLSRCRVVKVRPLQPDDLLALLRRALRDDERGLGGCGIEVAPEALEAIARAADGDARRALGLLEDAVTWARTRGKGRVERADLDAPGGPAVRFDRRGDEHYNLASAFIKSLRGSDPDAALYYMARMLEGGVDPRFVLRRTIIFASEDIGNADPHALPLAMAASDAFERLGLPEGAIPMAQAVTYLACAPKSNASYKALRAAQQAVREHGTLPIPRHILNAPTRTMRDLGYGAGYVYPHDLEGGFAPGVRYLPEALRGQRFYEPTRRGAEAAIAERLEAWRAARGGEDPQTER